MLKSQQRFKSENHEVYTENINKIALSSNDDKRIVALDRITSYPCGYYGEVGGSDGSYSASYIQDYFEYILKKRGESVDNPSIRMYINRIENRITWIHGLS